MKPTIILCMSFLLLSSANGQQRRSEVSVTIIGNKNLQLSVDGRDYAIVNGNISGNKTTILFNTLEMQQHILLITRTAQNSNRSERITATFNLRNRFDMMVKVNGNGSLELIETKRGVGFENHIAMSDADFSVLLRNVRNQRSVNGRRLVIANAFAVTNNYFTSSQVIQLLRLVNSESYKLQLAKSSYPLITDRNNFSGVTDILNSLTNREELQDYIDGYDDDYNDNGYANVAMSEADFTSLLRRIQQQWQVRDKVNSLTDAFSNTNNYFNANQAGQLIQVIDAEDSRLLLAKLSYRSIIDPANFSQVFNLLARQSSRDELTAYVNRYDNGGSSGVGMSEINFNLLYQDVESKFFPNEKMNSLTTTFNNTSYYFSCVQAKQLIQLVSLENNRLQLAKLSYRTITDRNNFNQLYDLLNAQASRNELDDYIRTYSN